MRFPKQLFPVAIAVVLGVAAAWAEPVHFNVPAQPAALALTVFARQADVEVLYSFDALKTVPAKAVIGYWEPEEALARLLHGTGFVGTRLGPRKFVVVRQQAESGAFLGVRGSGTSNHGAKYLPRE